MSKKVVALLPMKANSERVRGKNFRLFNGRPLYSWILDTLLSVPSIEKVVINTDAREILASHGLIETGRVQIRDRRPDLCGDFVSMNRILADDVANVTADVYVMTHTTNPLLTSRTVQAALDLYDQVTASGEGDSVFAVNRVQTRFYRDDGSPINHDPKQLIRTQDLEPWFEENSNLYIFSAGSFRASDARIGAQPKMYPMAKSESLDIDDQESWDMAEAMSMYVARHNHQER